MSDLSELQQSLSEMTDEQISERIRQIRFNRRTAAPAKRKSKAPRKVQTQSVKPMEINAKSIDAKAAAELIKLLGGGNEE